MRQTQHTNKIIGCLALALLFSFILSFAVTASTRGLAETCSSWMVLPLLGILAVMRRGI